MPGERERGLYLGCRLCFLHSLHDFRVLAGSRILGFTAPPARYLGCRLCFLHTLHDFKVLAGSRTLGFKAPAARPEKGFLEKGFPETGFRKTGFRKTGLPEIGLLSSLQLRWRAFVS